MFTILDKLVEIPIENEESIIGYLKEIEDVEDQDGVVIATVFLPEEQDYTYVVCWIEMIQIRNIH